MSDRLLVDPVTVQQAVRLALDGGLTAVGDTLLPSVHASTVDPSARTSARDLIRELDSPASVADMRATFARAASFARTVQDRCERIFNAALPSDIDGTDHDPAIAIKRRETEARIAKSCIDASRIAIQTYCLCIGTTMQNLRERADMEDRESNAGRSHSTRAVIHVHGDATINGNDPHDPTTTEIRRLLATLPESERAAWTLPVRVSKPVSTAKPKSASRSKTRPNAD